jgi:phosphotransacetylase
VLDNSATVRGVVNMTALCVVEAQDRAATGAGRV